MINLIIGKRRFLSIFGNGSLYKRRCPCTYSWWTPTNDWIWFKYYMHKKHFKISFFQPILLKNWKHKIYLKMWFSRNKWSWIFDKRNSTATSRVNHSLVSFTKSASRITDLWNENNTDMHSLSSDKYGCMWGGSGFTIRHTGELFCSCVTAIHCDIAFWTYSSICNKKK